MKNGYNSFPVANAIARHHVLFGDALQITAVKLKLFALLIPCLFANNKLMKIKFNGK